MLLRMRTGTCAIAALWASAALAFNVDGYRAGMSMAEVRRIAGEFRALTAPDGPHVTYLSRSVRGDWGGPAFTFCRGRLTAYQYSVPGGFAAFNRLVEQETRRLGAGSYGVQNNEGQVGSVHMLTFFFREHGSQHTIDLTVTAQWEPMVSRRWEAAPSICGE